ncbi:uncharacterized protein BDW47DRAFT_106903 [Aspergillus candidus]|uniref:Uncharacterized protein n=1 Tax=Aspergillus candidus TaxID=41067 RepID=A0A2I2F9R0_ASPCN|nr:hypothetical protein BDW47DRAFT_106903 [Aspergillus candidus]PLB37372.1 hypothetical protein BDW47DRAFT_106903 [Aspergillus candidus]
MIQDLVPAQFDRLDASPKKTQHVGRVIFLLFRSFVLGLLGGIVGTHHFMHQGGFLSLPLYPTLMRAQFICDGARGSP